ncbi:MAG: flagellar protein FlaG [Pseudodesulfovibrio sp.]|nr:flagellar protein FlaG [Pseudodesulfovibrio sp.]
MNILETTNERKGLHSESVVKTNTAVWQSVNSERAKVQADAIHKQNGTQSDKNNHDFSKEKLTQMVDEAQEHLKKNNIKLKFKILEEKNAVQVEIVDPDGKTIRKIPGDDLLKLSKSLKNLGQGFLDEVS